VIQESDVVKVLEQVLGKDLSDVSADTELFGELNLDSTAVLEILMAIEEQMGVSFDPETLEPGHLKSVGTLTDFIRGQAS
jgi:acyl carrier protein